MGWMRGVLSCDPGDLRHVRRLFAVGSWHAVLFYKVLFGPLDTFRLFKKFIVARVAVFTSNPFLRFLPITI